MAPLCENFRFQIEEDGAINPPLPTSPSHHSLSCSSSPMAGRRYEWINWDGLGNEAEEDAAKLNYDYEWVVSDQGMSNLVHPFLHPFFPS